MRLMCSSRKSAAGTGAEGAQPAGPQENPLTGGAGRGAAGLVEASCLAEGMGAGEAASTSEAVSTPPINTSIPRGRFTAGNATRVGDVPPAAPQVFAAVMIHCLADRRVAF